eukprot:3473409-Amphidinium_carterae.1
MSTERVGGNILPSLVVVIWHVLLAEVDTFVLFLAFLDSVFVTAKLLLPDCWQLTVEQMMLVLMVLPRGPCEGRLLSRDNLCLVAKYCLASVSRNCPATNK